MHLKNFIEKLGGRRSASGCICILGMHRSGTSCLTGILQNCGVELGEVFTANPFNKKGNRENAAIMALNEALLGDNDGAWDKPVSVIRWSSEQAVERDRIVRELSSASQSGYWGFKDPRTLLTLDFWLEAIAPQYIGTLRHPLSVAQSLQNRNGMPIEQGVELWYQYNRRLLELLQQKPFPIVLFDLPAAEYEQDVLAKLDKLGLCRQQDDRARAFFDDNLRSNTLETLAFTDMEPKVEQLYRDIAEYC